MDIRYKNITIQEIVPKTEQEKGFEVHYKHRDIFIILDGETTFQRGINYRMINQYNEEKDVQKVEVEKYETFALKAGDVIIFEPYEPHRPLLKAGSPTVKFIILKEKV